MLRLLRKLLIGAYKINNKPYTHTWRRPQKFSMKKELNITDKNDIYNNVSPVYLNLLFRTFFLK